MWARFWGPNNNGDRPDVEGPIEEVRGDGRVVINENGERTTVHIHGGWLRYGFVAVAVLVAASVLVPSSDYA